MARWCGKCLERGCKVVCPDLERCPKCGHFPASHDTRCKYCWEHPSKCTCRKELRPVGN